MEITVVFETYSSQVNHTTVTGNPDVIRHLAEVMSKGDRSFCIRTENGMSCQCIKYGVWA